MRFGSLIDVVVNQILHARASNAVVVSTPTSVKSLMLKLIELEQTLSDMRAQRNDELVRARSFLFSCLDLNRRHRKARMTAAPFLGALMKAITRQPAVSRSTAVRDALQSQASACVAILSLMRDGCWCVSSVSRCVALCFNRICGTACSTKSIGFCIRSNPSSTGRSDKCARRSTACFARVDCRASHSARAVGLDVSARLALAAGASLARRSAAARLGPSGALRRRVASIASRRRADRRDRSRARRRHREQGASAHAAHRRAVAGPKHECVSSSRSLLTHISEQEFYQSRLLTPLARWTVLWLSDKGLKGLLENDIVTFLVHGGGPVYAELVAPRCKYDDIHVKLLNLARDWLHALLPHVLSKVCLSCLFVCFVVQS